MGSLSSVYPFSASDIHSLLACEAPSDPRLLRELSTGIDFLSDFLRDQYLADYIPAGGSKIKFISGRKGAGKTFLGRLLLAHAMDQNYLTVHFSARQVWLHDFREIYLEILRQCDIQKILEGCARELIISIGGDPKRIPEGKTFMDYLSDKGEADGLIKNEIRGELRRMFLQNTNLDNNFAMCCSLLTGDILGYPQLEDAGREMLLGFLANDTSIRLPQLRSIGLAPTRVSKYNARHMLRSLCEVVKLSAHAGICVLIDDMDVLLTKSAAEPIHYTKMRRDDTYESIRQLIDDIDSMHHILFLFSFNRELIENESYGIKTYQALWMRIQSEVSGSKYNRFADIIDLDRLSDQIYTPEALVEMSGKLAAILNRLSPEDIAACKPGLRIDQARENTPSPVQAVEQDPPAETLPSDRFDRFTSISRETAASLIERSEFGGLGLPYLVSYSVLHPENE